MKDGIHPNYRPVVFRDASSGFAILTRSTIRTNQTTAWEDGNTYPLVTVDVSSASHPFYTGTQKFVDTRRPRRQVQQEILRHLRQGEEGSRQVGCMKCTVL